MSQLTLEDISCQEESCVECGFTKDGACNTLFADMIHIVQEDIIFPCHMFLKARTGSDNRGAETLSEVKVCRGYVAYRKKHNVKAKRDLDLWNKLESEIPDDELDNILGEHQLTDRHKSLKEHVYLNNTITTQGI